MSETAGAPLAPSKAKVFLLRLITTVILWTVILAALFSSHKVFSQGVFLFIVAFLAATGLLEFYGLAAKSGLPTTGRTISCACAVVAAASAAHRKRAGAARPAFIRKLDIIGRTARCRQSRGW